MQAAPPLFLEHLRMTSIVVSPTFSSLNQKFPWPSLSTRKRPLVSACTSADNTAQLTNTSNQQFSLPLTIEESIDQARYACRKAWKDGLRKGQLEFLLPLIGATDLDDWPGGIKQQFKAATPIVSSLLKGLIDKEETFNTYIVDDGDAVGIWESESVALVLFPNADSLEKVKDLVGVENRFLVLVNPQWQSGQVISDFGFGEKRKMREEFVTSFSVLYHLQQMRIMGKDVKILKCYPGNWQVFVVDSSGETECIAFEVEKPSYKRIEDLLRTRLASEAGKGWFARLLGEFKFNQDSLKG